MTHSKEQPSFTPTAAVAKEAARGLDLREAFGRGGTQVGVDRAKGLKARQPVDLANLKKIRAYFARHDVDKRGKNWASKTAPSAGYIAWLLWGGEAGRGWAERSLERAEAKS